MQQRRTREIETAISSMGSTEAKIILDYKDGEIDVPASPIQPGEFIFPKPLIEDSDIIYQRYEDADLVVTTQVTPLKASFGKKSHRLPLILAAGFLILGVIILMLLYKKTSGPENPQQANRYTIPNELTPFTVIGLLRKMRDEDFLAADIHPQLKQAIEKLERYYFERSEGDPPDLRALAEKWVTLAA